MVEAPPGTNPFRREALEHRAGGLLYSDVLLAPRAWLRWTYRLLLAVFAVGSAFVCVGTFDQYARGPFIVRQVSAATHDPPQYRVVVALPGALRPVLRNDQPVRLELTGFPQAYLDVPLLSLGDRVLGVEDARRLFGELDASSLGGSVLLAEAALAGTSFPSEGRRYDYFDGMRGVARVKVRRESLLGVLFPWVRGLR
jgi:hypothetical protein